jgi:hypothetical protein
MSGNKVKLFLSHASEDKDDFVRPLRDKLLEAGFDVWYDKDSLIVGQSLLRQISEGLKSANYGIVVLSPHFFSKKWPQEELDGLFALETAERKIIIPIWHNVSENEVKQYSAILAARVGSISKKGFDQVVSDIKRAVDFGERGRELADPVRTKFAVINRTAALNRKFDELGSTEQGVRLVWTGVSSLYSLLESRVAELRGELALPVVSDRFQPGSFIMVYGPKKLVLRFDIRMIYANNVRETRLQQRIYFEHEDYAGSFQGIELIEESAYSPFFTEDDQVVWIFANDRSTYSSADVVSRALNAFASRIQQVLDNQLIPSNTVQ